jgi:hypothetical protein
MHGWVLLGIPQTFKEVLCQVHHWELLLKPNSYNQGNSLSLCFIGKLSIAKELAFT